MPVALTAQTALSARDDAHNDTVAYDDIVNYVTARCRPYRVTRVDVEDIVQEAWAEILASVATFRPEKGSFGQWARGVARNVIRRYLRNARRYAERFSEYHSDMDEHPAPEPSPERCAQQQRAISCAAVTLSARQAEVLVFHAVDGMTHGDIAEELGGSIASIEKCFQRSRDRVAECFADEVLSVMPPFLTTCNESRSSTPYRWPEWSHYTGQITTAILAALLALLFLPAKSHPHASAIGEIHTGSVVQEDAIYRADKHPVVQDEPAAHRDAPVVKPEPASLPSVPVVVTPTRPVDKRTPPRDLAPLPPYKHTPDALDHRLPDR